MDKYHEAIMYEILCSVDPKIRGVEERLQQEPDDETLQQRLEELTASRQELGDQLYGYADPLP